jgi:hypothetical protein
LGGFTGFYFRYAVCGYSVDDIDASFEGEYQTFNEHGMEVSEPLPNKINVSPVVKA